MNRASRRIIYDFLGECIIPAAGSGGGQAWVRNDTSSSGSPTVQGVASGGVKLLFDNTNEVQNLCLSMGLAPFDIDDLISVEFVLKPGGTLNAATSLAFGMLSTRNDAIDSIAEQACFRLIGSNALLCESDDGTTDKDDIATGITVSSSAWSRFRIDFASGHTTISPPSTSQGGKSNISFFASDSTGSLKRVATGTRFDMSAFSGNLQPFVQLQKTASTNTDSVTVLRCEIEFRTEQ